VGCRGSKCLQRVESGSCNTRQLPTRCGRLGSTTSMRGIRQPPSCPGPEVGGLVNPPPIITGRAPPWERDQADPRSITYSGCPDRWNSTIINLSHRVRKDDACSAGRLALHPLQTRADVLDEGDLTLTNPRHWGESRRSRASSSPLSSASRVSYAAMMHWRVAQASRCLSHSVWLRRSLVRSALLMRRWSHQ